MKATKQHPSVITRVLTVIAAAVAVVTGAHAQTLTLTVNLSSTLRGATHCASGSLYGVTENLPSDMANLVAPLNPNVFNNPARAGSGYQQPIGAAIPVAGRLTSTTGKVSIRLADLCPYWPYAFPGMTSWLDQVKSVINDKKSSGYGNFYGYEIWNEPDGTWNSNNGDFNSVLWKQTYDLIRSMDSGAKIIGPSYSWYDHNAMSTFLTYCKNNNCLPDVIGWHDLNGSGYIINEINDYRAMESSLGISARLISINEYCHPNHDYEGCPGTSAPFIAKFERKLVDSACISWWFTALPGRLGSLLTSGNEKGGGWWFYKWYGDMTGNMVSVTPPNDSSDGIDGFACVDSQAKFASICLGGNNTGTVNVVISGIPSFFGSSVNATIEYVPWSNKDTAVSGPTTVSTTTYTISGGSITVPVNVTSTLFGYRVYLVPTTRTGTYYYMQNRTSGLVIDSRGATSVGSQVAQWSKVNSANLKWLLVASDSGYYYIQNQTTGLYLDGGGSTSWGAAVKEWSYDSSWNLQWQLVASDSGNYYIKNRATGLYLDGGGATASGAALKQWGSANSYNLQWSFQTP